MAERTLPPTLRVLLPLLILSAFLTQTKFIPGIRNNVGPFELVGAVVIAYGLLGVRGADLKLHPLIRIVLAMTFAAGLSQFKIPYTHRQMGLIQLAILIFLSLILLALYNLSLRYPISPGYLLHKISYATLIVGPWILAQGLRSGDIEVAGPFRNRAHMGSYMLTAFWLNLIYALWPDLKRRDRVVAYAGVSMSLYAVAVSGRRSVYLSLIFGLVGLVCAFVVTQRGRRVQVASASLFVVGILVGLYTVGSRVIPQVAFFQERVGMIDDRLHSALGDGQNSSRRDSFFLLQRSGVRRAFSEHPILGIGWGAFARSQYSPTGHEVHSTPLRFLAELGLIGIVLYTLLIGSMLTGAFRIMRRLRSTAFGPSGLVTLIGLSSLTVSYLYNRHITERTFWLFLIVYLSMDLLANAVAHRRRSVAAPRTALRTPAGAVPLAQRGVTIGISRTPSA